MKSTLLRRLDSAEVGLPIIGAEAQRIGEEAAAEIFGVSKVNDTGSVVNRQNE